jgi:hypothetical protein
MSTTKNPKTAALTRYVRKHNGGYEIPGLSMKKLRKTAQYQGLLEVFRRLARKGPYTTKDLMGFLEGTKPVPPGERSIKAHLETACRRGKASPRGPL